MSERYSEAWYANFIYLFTFFLFSSFILSFCKHNKRAETMEKVIAINNVSLHGRNQKLARALIFLIHLIHPIEKERKKQPKSPQHIHYQIQLSFFTPTRTAKWRKKKRNKEKKFMAAILRAVYIHYTLTTVHSKKRRTWKKRQMWCRRGQNTQPGSV